MRTERAEPILPASSLDETRAFYEKLGFVAWWKGRGPFAYEIVSRGHLVARLNLLSEGIPPLTAPGRSAVGDARVHPGRSIR